MEAPNALVVPSSLSVVHQDTTAGVSLPARAGKGLDPAPGDDPAPPAHTPPGNPPQLRWAEPMSDISLDSRTENERSGDIQVYIHRVQAFVAALEEARLISTQKVDQIEQAYESLVSQNSALLRRCRQLESLIATRNIENDELLARCAALEA